MKTLPYLGITMGDPAGIGPEVIAKSLAKSEIYSDCIPFVIGSSAVMNRATQLIKSDSKTVTIRNLKDIRNNPHEIYVLDDNSLEHEKIKYGEITAEAGQAAVKWILQAGELAAKNQIQAIVTAPINKESAKLAGYDDIGHQEIFQRQTNSQEVVTMLMTRNLRVVHLTTHRSLKKACDYVTMDNILSKINLTHKYFQKWGFSNPKIGVAALNPHASDGGLIGNEETSEIEPAVLNAIKNSINVQGPIPADTIFNQAIDGLYDVVIAMYHDQGHIPIKVYDWKHSVSVNLGLPFIRTSVDHGTAFNIAGQGIADPTSMLESINVAKSLANKSILP